MDFEYDDLILGKGGPERMTLPVARCGDCLYWARYPQNSYDGECVRRAPQDSLGKDRQHDNWCGEFIHRELGGQREWTGIGKHTGKQWRFPTEAE